MLIGKSELFYSRYSPKLADLFHHFGKAGRGRVIATKHQGDNITLILPNIVANISKQIVEGAANWFDDKYRLVEAQQMVAVTANIDTHTH